VEAFTAPALQVGEKICVLPEASPRQGKGHGDAPWPLAALELAAGLEPATTSLQD
jgi:hypothetical protein